MTAIFLVFFSVLFYQLLIKPILNPKTIPNSKQNENLMQIWRNLQDFHAEKENKKPNNSTKKNPFNKYKKGFQGGEYIDYEEI